MDTVETVAQTLEQLGYGEIDAETKRTLATITFKNGTKVLREPTVALEFLGMCEYYKESPDLDERIQEAQEFDSAEDYLWGRGTVVMSYLASTVKREETMKLFKPKVITNLEPCKRCGSKNIRYAMKQIRALDEGQSVLIQCANCGLSNRVA